MNLKCITGRFFLSLLCFSSVIVLLPFFNSVVYLLDLSRIYTPRGCDRSIITFRDLPTSSITAASLKKCTMAKMTSIKGSFLALGARSQSWKLNNSWKIFLVKLTGVTSCALQFDRNFFCSNNSSNVKCKVSDLKIKIAEKGGQLALIS